MAQVSELSAREVGLASTGPATPAWVTRLVWMAVAIGALSVLLLARWLEPDPRGFGTHEQLGLPPCGFAQLTGLLCPSCGLTTAFAYMARGFLTPALEAHALGPLLFALTCASIPFASVASARAWPISVTLQRLRAPALAVIIAGTALVYWVVRSIVSTL